MDLMRKSQSVRIVARISGSTSAQDVSGLSETETPLITVRRPEDVSGGKVFVSLAGEQKNNAKQRSYQMDEFYTRDVTNWEIFDKEIKSLIPSLFEGQNVTIFTYGARKTGKTHTIQGLEDDPGLAVLSISKLLSHAEENGNSISISLYEVDPDHVFDLLDSEGAEVSILEDVSGNITLKGLSKVPIKSISEFHKLYSTGDATVRKSVQKMVNQAPRRTHRGLMIHVLNERSDTKVVCKMNLVDLAGYEDSRRLSIDTTNHLDITRINKSLYAIHKVLYALNSNETHVPYRESKLMRMLQDSLRDAHKILLVTCMSPSLTEDTIKTLSLASQTCQAASQCTVLSTRKTKTEVKAIELNSPRPLKPINKSAHDMSSSRPMPVNKSTSVTSSPKPAKPLNKSTFSMSSPRFMAIHKSASVRKGVLSSYYNSGKELRDTEAKERRIFNEAKESNRERRISDEAKESNKRKQASPMKNSAKSSTKDQVNSSVETENSQNSLIEEVKSSFCISKEMEPSQKLSSEEVNSSFSILKETQLSQKLRSEEQEIIGGMDENVMINSHNNSTPESFSQKDKENMHMQENVVGSPPLSARLLEFSNNLKSLITEPDVLCNDSSDPKTPYSQPNRCLNVASPWDRFHMRSSGMKDSLVNESLRFLNSANKEDLKKLKWIGERRAEIIVELRDESPEPFKSLDDLKDIGLTTKQIKDMMRNVADF